MELTSEDPRFPIEGALTGKSPGWRAGEKGDQSIRIIFNDPTSLHRVRLEFFETERQRTQEFTLRWSDGGETFQEIVRQQWTFSPQGSTSEVEDYAVELNRVSILELVIRPDLTPDNALATLSSWRVS